ncbi:MAG TPA: hypothetical protein VNC50_10480 [Planctomycetia bacterium]|nr:hypothetical protein [Planctomycetia bacterium]
MEGTVHDGTPPPVGSTAVSIGSAFVLVHFLAVILNVVAVRTGPWPTFDGTDVGFSDPPAFADAQLMDVVHGYLGVLRLDETGQFPSNRRPLVAAKIEAVLYDAEGKEMAKLPFPDPSALPAVRARQKLLVSALAIDVPRLNPGAEPIAAPGTTHETAKVWRNDPDHKDAARLEAVPLYRLSRSEDNPDYGPSDWSLQVSYSLSNYLCRTHGAAAVEIVRTAQRTPSPAVLTMRDTPDADFFKPGVNRFGKVSFDASR